MAGNIRDISPFLQMFRNFLLGRKHTLAVRFQKDLATRSPPPPELPDGPAHKLSDNYYCLRDVRREVEPPELLVDGGRKLLASEAEPKKDGLLRRKPYMWDWAVSSLTPVLLCSNNTFLSRQGTMYIHVEKQIYKSWTTTIIVLSAGGLLPQLSWHCTHGKDTRTS